MKFKKDWTFAHFLFYMFRISFWLILASVLISFTVPVVSSLAYENEKSIVAGYPIPIRMEIREFSEYGTIENEELTVSIGENVTGIMMLEAKLSQNLPAFLFYNGVIYFKWIAVLVALFFGTKLFKNIAEGKHFNENNPKYLFIIGATLLIASIGYMLISLTPLPIIADLVQTEFVNIKHVLIAENNFMLGGFICIALGYVFKKGNRIHEEQKLTV